MVVYKADVIVGSGGIRMFNAQSLFTYGQIFGIILQRFVVVSEIVIYQTDVIVRFSSFGMFYAI